ncbi:MAG: hypothetical protein ACI89W_001739 [Gammaproteobacteria bacterium]|jgi:hypothetical protein
MNRRKKSNQILKARAKKANIKLSGNSKPKYISKADRDILAIESIESTEDTNSVSENLS